MSSESPDLPWAKNYDLRTPPKPIDLPPDPQLVLFYNSLKSRGIDSGRILEIEANNIANMNLFFCHGFEASVMSHKDTTNLNFDQYGVTSYCHSAFDYWPFEDEHFDFVIDLHTNFADLSMEKSQLYFENLSRTLVEGGFVLLKISTSASKFGFQLEKKLTNEYIMLRKTSS